MDSVRIAMLLATLCGCALSGCAALPERPAVPPSHAIADFGATRLGETAQRSLGGSPDSGFQLMPVAWNAYAARIELIREAQQTLDVQYYLLQADRTGEYLMRSLRDAALRGVRVRILIDDLYTAGEDPILTALAATPHVEVRLFNPFPAGRSGFLSRLLASAADLERVDHRMHNKLLVADNAFAVAGGRNMADEYFMRSKDNNFIDMDVLAAGAVVRQLSGIFDTYWNSPYVFPLEVIAPTALPVAERQHQFEALTATVEPPPGDDGVPSERLKPYSETAQQLQFGAVRLTVATADAFADPVEKAAGRNDVSRAGTVRERLANDMRGARESVFVISPYYVPGDLGMQAMTMLRGRGVELTLFTNSLASTDEKLAHAAYLDSRLEMLQLGVHIYELSPELAQQKAQMGHFGESLGRLHAKMAVIDHSDVFVGSMNLDERSERRNTELGILIHSPALAAEFEGMSAFRSSTYRLELTPDGRHIRWVSGSGAETRVYDVEPETTWWDRVQVELFALIVPDSEL